MHVEPHKRGNGDYSSQGRLDFSNFSFLKTDNQTWKLWNCLTEEKLSTFEIRVDDIVKIAGSSDPSKAQGHNEISIHTIKICASSISKQLATFFGNSFENKCFL